MATTRETPEAPAAESAPADEWEAAKVEAEAALKAAAETSRPEALDAFYVGLERGVVVTCELARVTYKRSVAGLRLAHDALAGGASGKTFKDWCTTAGISYNTAKSALSREQRKQEEQKKQGGKEAVHPCTLAVKFASDEEKSGVVSRLRAVLEAVGEKEDRWLVAVLALLDTWEAQHQKAA